MTSYSPAQGTTGDQALASIAQRTTAEQLPMAVVFSALDADVGSEAETGPSLLRDAPSGLVLLPGDGENVGSEVKPETG